MSNHGIRNVILNNNKTIIRGRKHDTLMVGKQNGAFPATETGNGIIRDQLYSMTACGLVPLTAGNPANSKLKYKPIYALTFDSLFDLSKKNKLDVVVGGKTTDETPLESTWYNLQISYWFLIRSVVMEIMVVGTGDNELNLSIADCLLQLLQYLKLISGASLPS